VRAGATALRITRDLIESSFVESPVNTLDRSVSLAAKAILASAFAATAFIAGCGDSSTPPSRLTAENFDAIQKGMSKVQVIQILGRWREEVPEKPGQPPYAVLHCRWKDGPKQIDIIFDGDKVTSKSSSGISGLP
jgi:hypothetical protein